MSFNFRKIGGRKYKAWKEWEENEYLVGRFIEEYEDSYGNPGYEVEVIESDVEDFKEGDIVGLNSCGSLNHKMSKVQKDAVIKIIYAGKDVMDKGKYKGKEFHQVEFFLDESSSLASAAESSDDEADDKDLGL